MKTARQNEIMNLLLMERSLKTEDLAKRLRVSEETIRRDFNVLEAQKVAHKVYGGIELPPDSRRLTEMAQWETRLARCHAEKVRIATKALELLPDKVTVALDIGTTIQEFSVLLSTKKELTVLTNSLRIAANMAQNTNHRIYCIGGLMSHMESVTGGMAACDFLDSFSALDFYICSTDGITLENGMTEVEETVVAVKRRLVKKSDKVICLADHSKFGKRAFFTTCTLKDLDTLITDEQTDEWYLKQLRAAGVKVIVAR